MTNGGGGGGTPQHVVYVDQEYIGHRHWTVLIVGTQDYELSELESLAVEQVVRTNRQPDGEEVVEAEPMTARYIRTITTGGR